MDKEERLTRHRVAGQRYRLTHPRRVQEQRRRYYLSHPEEQREKWRKWRQDNPEKITATNHKCYLRRQNACIDCGKFRSCPSPRCHACDIKNRTGEGGPAWKGGIRIDKGGYRGIYIAPGKYKPEHRIIWEEGNGPIPEGCVIHHSNGDRVDNRLENLALMTKPQHVSLHRRLDPQTPPNVPCATGIQ